MFIIKIRGKNIIDNFVFISKVQHIDNKDEIKKSIFCSLDWMKDKGKIDLLSSSKVLIKPNICYMKGYETGTTVDPFIVKCIVDWLLENYDLESILIGEADATELDIDIAFKILGWEKTFKGYSRVHLLNLSKDDLVDIEYTDYAFKKLQVSKKYINCDFLISVGKLKTHTKTGLTCILKNQFGAITIKKKAQYHKFLDEAILEANRIRYPDLCIVDGIIGMEGDGPISGIPKPLGIIVFGNDAVATDYICAKIMGLKADRISHLKLCRLKGLGTLECDTYGENIGNIKNNFKNGEPLWKKIIVSIYENKIISRIPIWPKFE